MTTSETAPRRFPLILTLVAAVALSMLVGLGVWQLQRLAWKRDLLSRIEALKTSPPRSLEAAMASAREGADVEWTRVVAACAAGDHPQGLLYGLAEGQVAWRALAYCRDVAGVPVVVDRGYVNTDRGALAPAAIGLPAPRRVTGVLRRAAKGSTPATPIAGGYRFAARDGAAPERLGRRAPTALAFYLVAEQEDPAPQGVTPAPLPPSIPNRHLEYALTWFGLAAALTGVYLAMLFRRLRDR